jgi:hypothetical protein
MAVEEWNARMVNEAPLDGLVDIPPIAKLLASRYFPAALFAVPLTVSGMAAA